MHRADLEKRLLQRMQSPVLLQPFDSRDFFLPDLANRSKAGVRWRAIDQNRARAALAFAAAVFGAREIEPIAKDGEQRIVGGNLGMTNCAVHPQCQMRRVILAAAEPV